MAQDPPKNDGKLRLPKVDGAMNKIAPTLKGGGRGAKAERPLGQDKTGDHRAKVIGRAIKRMDRAIQSESENRKAGLEDLKFKAGDQWPADVAAQRNFDKRPCLTVNKMKTFVHQVTNDLRQNRPTINVSPVGERGDVEVAKMYRGLIRAIERESSADIAYDTGADNAVSNGFGYWRILTEFENADSFNQVITIRRVRNPFTVYLDPDHQEPDGADARYGFISEMIPRSEFEEQHPDADPMPWTQAGVGESMKNWATQDAVRIAEYFEVDHKGRTLVALSNGHTGWKDELSEEVKSQIAAGTIEILREREAEERKITWYKLTAKDILEEREWLGKWIPIVKVIGDEIDVEGKVKLSGIIRDAKDSQRMINYWETAYTEAVALAPKAPFIMEEGQVEGHEATWKQANTKSYPYLLYKGVNLGGKPAPVPQRQVFAGVPAGIQQAIQNSTQNMMATTGIRFDATMHERMIDESGKAIRELRNAGDIGAFHYVDNFARSLRHTGRILIDLIPKIYDTKRILTILREDDTEERVQIDPHAQRPYQEMRPAPTPQQPNPKTLKIFNPKYGEYGVTVTIGPSYATKRIEASENMVNFARAFPQAAPLIADLVAKNQDWPGGEQIAARLAKAVPPNLLTPDQKDIPPQIQALMQAMDAQIKQLGMERQQLMIALNEKNTDRRMAQDAVDKQFHAKVMAIKEKFAEALLKTGAKQDETAMKAAHGSAKLEHEAMRDLMALFMQLDDKAAAEEKPPEPPVHKPGQSPEELASAIAELTKLVKAPRKARLQRGADGRATHIISEIQ